MAQKVAVVELKKDGKPVLRMAHPAQPKTPQSLLDKIRAAKTVDEVDKLLLQGRDYLCPSSQTRRRWARAATVRKATLLSLPPKAKPE